LNQLAPFFIAIYEKRKKMIKEFDDLIKKHKVIPQIFQINRSV